LNNDWSISTTVFFKKPSEFRDYITSVTDSFKATIAGWSAPTNQDTCGNIITTDVDYMFQVLFCKLGKFLHSIASWSMGKAVEYLNAYIGVSHKFEEPTADTSAGLPTSGGTTPTENPSTPGATGGTPAGGTTAPAVEVLANINIPNTSYFNTLKSAADSNPGSLWVKIAPLTQSGAWQSKKQIAGAIDYKGTAANQVIILRIYANTAPDATYPSLGIVGGVGTTRYFDIVATPEQVRSGKYNSYTSTIK